MASDIVVLPYTNISESGVLRYAQTCGRTVVCSDLKEFRDTVVHGETGYLFEKGNHIDLAEQIKNACLNGQLERIGENAKRLMKERYNWNKIASIIKCVYNEMSLKQKNGRDL